MRRPTFPQSSFSPSVRRTISKGFPTLGGPDTHGWSPGQGRGRGGQDAKEGPQGSQLQGPAGLPPQQEEAVANRPQKDHPARTEETGQSRRGSSIHVSHAQATTEQFGASGRRVDVSPRGP